MTDKPTPEQIQQAFAERDVYLAIEGNWQDYEGGGDAVLGAFSTEAKALEYLKAEWKKNGKRADRFKPDAYGDYHLSRGPSHRWLRIDNVPIDALAAKGDSRD